MKLRIYFLTCVYLAPFLATGAIRYVDGTSSNPTPPYTNWLTAAATIQDAIDISDDGDQLLVADGHYQTGGRVVYGSLTNRLAVTRAITIQSVNGPESTFIHGYQVPGSTNGDSAVRCVYMTNNAMLSGFTITNGATRVLGDPYHERSGGGVCAESISVVVSNCVLIGNAANLFGGGALSNTLVNCALNSNFAQSKGGAAYGCTLFSCGLTNNGAGFWGGGLSQCVASNACIVGNWSSQSGGGSSQSTLNNCSLIRNSAQSAGGAQLSTLNNCAVWGNTAISGGGTASCTLNNCTLTGNLAAQAEGGAGNGSIANNSIIYYNSAPSSANFATTFTCTNCCTFPLPPSGTGNITLEPQLTDLAHISGRSPCHGAGDSRYANGSDIDGEQWTNPPSIGCDEYYSGSITGALTVSIEGASVRQEIGFPVNLFGAISGHASAAFWTFDDSTIVSNRPYISRTWTNAGDYAVILQVFNEDNPGGVSATSIVHVADQVVYFVDANSANPVAPYSSWSTAATTIQNAVDAALPWPHSLVLVTNGVYQTGGRVVFGALTNRLVIAKPILVQSVNGPSVTSIQGFQVPGTTNGDAAVRCVYLTNSAILSGFTLTNGATRLAGDVYREESGGGAFCVSNVFLTNCVLTGNSAFNTAGGCYGGNLISCDVNNNSADHGGGTEQATLDHCTLRNNYAPTGGGADYGVLNNCVVISNSSYLFGAGVSRVTANNCLICSNFMTSLHTDGYAGGAYSSTPNNCTIVGNIALTAGGVGTCVPNNCIIYFNTAIADSHVFDNHFGGTMNYCCTTPLPTGPGNFTNLPAFVNQGSDFHLQSNSPCINSGKNTYVTSTSDLDGSSRISAGTVDIGAYEYQNPPSIISYYWLQQYGMPGDGSADFADTDGDGMNNYQEWRCGTNPTNSLSVLTMLGPTNGGSGINVGWLSVSGITYYLQRGTNLMYQPMFSSIRSNIVGQTGVTTVVDTTANGAGPFFYRVGVQQ